MTPLPVAPVPDRGGATRRVLPAVLAALLVAARAAAADPPAAGPVGDPARGEVAYARLYRCYACHGTDGQSAAVRLVPMRFTRAAFIAFVRSPARAQMPSYADAPLQDLADIYAYVASLPVDAPDPEAIPLLEDILDRQRRALDRP